MNDWLSKHEALARLAYRLAVVALLGLCLAELRRLPHWVPDVRQLESDSEVIRREVSAIRGKLTEPEPIAEYNPCAISQQSAACTRLRERLDKELRKSLDAIRAPVRQP